jgi:5-methylcytosine-specific restriction endonuclease McrA
LTFVLLVYKVYAQPKESSQSYYGRDLTVLHRINTELEGELWQNRIDLQTATNQLNLAKMSHEKTKQELEDKARTWENQYNAIKNESGRN